MFEESTNALDALFTRIITKVGNTLTSTKFLFAVVGVLIGYLEGGTEGLLLALGSIIGFTATKAYQNVKLKQADTTLKGEELKAPKPVVPIPECYFDGEVVDILNAAADIVEETEIGEDETDIHPSTLNLDGLIGSFMEQGITTPFALNSRLTAKFSTFDLRPVPKRQWVTFTIECVERLTLLMQQSFVQNIPSYPVPGSAAEIGGHPRDLLYRIKKSMGCGKYAGEIERVHVWALWRRFKQHRALKQIQGQKIDWKKIYGENRVTPLEIARRARKGGMPTK